MERAHFRPLFLKGRSNNGSMASPLPQRPTSIGSPISPTLRLTSVDSSGMKATAYSLELTEGAKPFYTGIAHHENPNANCYFIVFWEFNAAN